jgi:hypothetical protein
MGRFTGIGLFTGPVKSAFPVESPFRFVEEPFFISLGNVRFVNLVMALGAHREPVFGGAQQTTFSACHVVNVSRLSSSELAPRLAERMNGEKRSPHP